MNLPTYPKNFSQWPLKHQSLNHFFSLLVILGLAIGPLGSVQAAPGIITAAPAVSAAPTAVTTTTLTLQVVDALSPSTILPTYEFLINEDNTGDPRDAETDCRPLLAPEPLNATLANCDWPSIHKMPGNAPIVTQGNQDDFNGDVHSGFDLPDGKYLISVVADGYKIGGAHFTMPIDTANGPVVVELEPNPLPTLTFRAMVFNDNTSPNGAMDNPGEEGLNGFEGHIADVLGEISTDWFGNPLCTEYQRDGSGAVIVDSEGSPIPLPGTGGVCLSGDRNHDGVLSDEENDPNLNPDYGQIVIPNLGSNRFAASVVPPDGSNWVQTTSLEGGHDWDTWLLEGSTGYDTEFLYQNELFPWAVFGFVKPTSFPTGDTYPGEVKGRVWAVNIYVPSQGGLPLNNNGIHLAGTMGAKRNYPVDRPYIALADLNNGDQMVYMGRGNPDGTFDIQNVPPSDYVMTVWDGPQNLILLIQQITVTDTVTYAGDTWEGEPGNIGLAGWFTTLEGSVFIDSNVNGKRDPGEKGLSQQAIALKMRGNSLMQHGGTGITTDANGHYIIRNVYPLNAWVVMEVYNDLYYTTGITFQADNQLEETTVMGQGVDVNVLPIIGLGGRLDWGVLPYKRTQNGGIAGSISYDVTRNELDPRLAAAEDWQPGVPNLNVNLYPAVKCIPTSTLCDPRRKYEIEADGSFKKGALQQTYLSESWERPAGCIARDVYGNPITIEYALPTSADGECVEAPMSGMQFGPMNDPNDPDAGFGAAVDGNFGFGDIPAGDYLVEVEIPNDPILGRPLYKVTREEDINVFEGDAYSPQLPPSACAGALHIVDVAGVGADGPDATVNPNLADAGGSPYEGRARHLCDVKLVRLQNGRSIAPGFNLFTDVPLPARFMGLLVDNLNLSANSQGTTFGEAAGIPYSPVGIYDFNGRLLHTVESDPNGMWEVLMPSSLQINCPTPSGVCPNMFNFVGNDPGQPYHRNTNWNPQYQTISAAFESWPGVINPADLAPMPIAASVVGNTLGGIQTTSLARCVLPGTTPKFFAVDKPYVSGSGDIVISGDAFGTFGANSQITLDGSALTVSAANWTNSQITATIPAGFPVGPHQLHITADSGQSIINGLTLHVLGAGYSPTVIEVGPGKTYDPVTGILTDPISGLPYEHALQNALEAAANVANALVVVYPNAATPNSNPLGEYFENIIIHSPVKLQGVGPGGIRADGSVVGGSILDGIGYAPGTAPSNNWYTLVNGLAIQGNPNISDGEVVYVVATSANQYGATYRAAIDGFTIQGGDQLGLAAPVTQPGVFLGDVPTQGGGIYVHGYANHLQITNNVLQSNGGAYGGAIRVGTPENENHNHNLRIAHNRILANGGTNLAGAIGLFRDSDNYEVDHNDLCGNFSAEYGGAISHFGRSDNGKLHDNRLYFNQSVDEAAGIMVGGELPLDALANYGTPNGPQGAGAVDIYNNLIQSNIASDDGGGLRFLMAGNFPYNVYNNLIVNNISAHEGGGVALDDAPAVRFFNNTVMKNLTTDTAVTAVKGVAYPAGLSTGPNSMQLQATLPFGSPLFSTPLLFNNIFWDNRAGSYNAISMTVEGLGLVGDVTPTRYWDMGSTDNTIQLAPTNSILSGDALSNIIASPTNQVGFDPQVVEMYSTPINIYPWRSPNQPAPVLIVVDQPGSLPGDYHLTNNTSPAYNAGATSKGTTSAPTKDIDNEARPAFGGYDIGADEIPAFADLSITKDDGQTVAPSGSTVHYTIVVSNNGPEAATALVTDNFPAAFSNVAWTCAGAACAAATGSGNIAMTVNLLNGGSVTFTANATLAATAYGSVSNTATVLATGGTTDSNLGNNSATDTDTIPTADLQITKTDGQTSALMGGGVQYTIVVSNNGPDAVTGATVTDNFPAALTVTGWTCSASAGSACTPGGTGNARTGTVDLPAGGSATFTGNATLATTATGTLVNTASVATPAGIADPNLANNSATDTDTIRPSLHVADLDATFSNQSTSNWQASVVVTIHSATHVALSNATVTGHWSAGNPSPVTCTTNNSGQCTFSRNGFSKATVPSVTFTVDNVTRATGNYGYLANLNHDPESDSNGTAITITLPTMHVGDLDASVSNQNTNNWQANVVVTVHNANHAALSGASVTGHWTVGDAGSVNCTTNASGQCTLSRNGFSKASVASATFIVDSLTHGSQAITYQASANHDPDGDSTGTAITITLPTMHVGDLDRTSSNTSGTQWQAVVTITVHNSTHAAVSGAVVNVTWTGGGSGGTSCTTTASGQCTVTRTGLSRTSASSATLTVSSVTHATQAITYQSSANHDPDAAPQNSDGTTITVIRP